MTITLDAKQIDQALDQALLHQAKSMRINGFRPGKVPLAMVKQQHGVAMRDQVLKQLLEKQFEQATEQHSLHPAGEVRFTPNVQPESLEFIYQADFEIYPEITLQGVTEIVVEKPQVEITESDIEEHVQQMRHGLATWHSIERPATLGDRVTLNFQGTIDGEPFEGGSAQDFVLTLGENKFIAGFAEGILDHQAGDEFTLEITFPNDYAAKALQGRTAQFSIQLVQVEACTLPEWDSDTLQELGVEEGSLERFKAIVHESLEGQLQQLIRQRMKEEFINKWFEAHGEILVPGTLVNEQLAQSTFQIEKTGRKLEAADREELHQRIERRIAIGLLLAEVIKQRSLKLDETRLEQRFHEKWRNHDKPELIAAQYRKHPELMDRLCSEVLEDQAVEMLLDEVTVVEKAYTFSEVLKKIA
jgi:trigger factor